MKLLPYAHPIAAGLSTLLLFYIGSLGLRARNDRRRAAQLLEQHARFATPVLWLIVISWLGGLSSTWLLRHDLDLAASAHMRIGSAVLLALCGSAVTARRMSQAQIRDVHPWIGGVALLLVAAQVFFGLQITP